MKLLDSGILYCDNHILIANKPAGLLTQPNDTEDSSLELEAKAWVKKKYHKPGNVYLHAVHRLDRPVSGLVLFARTSKALSRLNEAQRNMEIQRIYIAEVEGELALKEGQLDHYLIHKEHRAILGKPEDRQAKHARLYFKVLEYRSNTTVVEVELETGRYHQIRAQFSASKHPIVGDDKYGGCKKKDRVIHLHSSRLSLKHPTTLEMLKFQAPPPF